jgi:hypothetical protein
VYPNPNNGLFKLIVSQDDYFFTINDLKGSVVHSSKLNDINNITEVDISHLPKGIYFMRLYNRNGIKSKKIVIQ